LRENKATRRWQNMPKMTILTITFLDLFIEVFGGLGKCEIGKMTKFGEIGI